MLTEKDVLREVNKRIFAAFGKTPPEAKVLNFDDWENDTLQFLYNDYLNDRPKDPMTFNEFKITYNIEERNDCCSKNQEQVKGC